MTTITDQLAKVREHILKASSHTYSHGEISLGCALSILTTIEQSTGWQDISTAPRDSSRILVAYKTYDGEWRVREVWWRLPYEGAPNEQCWWCHGDTGTLLDSSIHTGLGATHWQPLPAPPKSGKSGG